jgi:hypothetical protein
MRRLISIFAFLGPVLLALASPAGAQRATNPGCTFAGELGARGLDSVKTDAGKTRSFYSFKRLALVASCPSTLPVDSATLRAAEQALADSSMQLAAVRTSLAVATAALKRALDSLAKWPTATPTPAPDTTPTQPPTVPPPSDTSAPNRPAGWTNSTRLDFSQAVPSLPDDRDRPIPGAPAGWNMIYFGTNWQSAGGQFIGTWSPGSYGGGVIGQGSGHGIGNVFTTTPTRVTRLYLRMRVYFDHAADQWHPISNKFVNIETDAGLLLVQLKEGSYWRHAEELVNGGRSWWIDRENSPGMVDNRPIPVRQWVRLEVLIDLPNRVFKVWQDGVLTTDARPTFSATRLNGVGWNAFRGGGGETLTSTLRYRYDDFLVAW